MAKPYLKMYIAVLNSAPAYMVPTLVAHTILNADSAFTSENSMMSGQDKQRYIDWKTNSFKKVVISVNPKEFAKIQERLVCFAGHERTILNGDKSCLVILPVYSDNIPNVLSFARLWKP